MLLTNAPEAGTTELTTGGTSSLIAFRIVCVLTFAVAAYSVTAPADSATVPVSAVPIVAASVNVTTSSLSAPVVIAVGLVFAAPVAKSAKVKSPLSRDPSFTGSLKVTSTVVVVTVRALSIAGPAPSVAGIGP